MLSQVSCTDHQLCAELFGVVVEANVRCVRGYVQMGDSEVQFAISVVSRERLIGVGIVIDGCQVIGSALEDYTNYERLTTGLREIANDVPAAVRCLVIQHVDQVATQLREQHERPKPSLWNRIIGLFSRKVPA